MRGELYLIAATLVAALGWVASKLVIIDMPGVTFIAYRFLLASFILLPFCYKQLSSLPLIHLIKTSCLALILAISLQIWIYAISITNSISVGAFIMSLAMLIVPITSWLLFRTRPTRGFWLALPIAILGMMLLSITNGWHVEKSQLYFLLSAALLSIHFVLNKRMSSEIKPLPSICVQLFIVGLSSVVFAGLIEPQPFQLNPNSMFWFVISVTVATALRYLMQTIGQYKVNAEKAALIMILEPVWTVVLSIGLLNEEVEPQKLFGGSIILLSLIVYVKLSQRQFVKNG